MNAPMPDHDSRTYVAPPREATHLIADGQAVTLCCGRTPFELPRTERITVDPKLRNCRPAHPLAAFEAATVAAFRGTPSIEAACEVMHDAYEKAAVGAGWETQAASRKPWADVPDANKETMRAAVRALLTWLPTTPVPVVLGFDGSSTSHPTEQTLREDVDDLRAWVAMQHEASGLDSSDQAAGEFHAYKRVLSHLLKILAAHRAESASAQVEITDAAVGAARTAYSKACRDIRSDGPARVPRCFGGCCSAARSPAGLDRETVRERIWRSLAGTGLGGIFRDELAEAQADAVMEMVRPMPTREQIDTALAGKPIVRSADKPSDWRGGLSPNEIDDVATIVLALLNGAES